MFYILDIFGGVIPLLVLLFIVVSVFIKISNLKERVLKLERLVGSKQSISKINQEIPLKQQTAEVHSQAGVENKPEMENKENTVGDDFVNWLKEDWLLKLGGLLLLIGFGWFTTYAFMHDWIGEVGRIMLGLLAGVLVLGLGSWRINKYLNQGGIFLVIGSAIILLVVFAARGMYEMFTPSIALIIMFMSTAYISLMSVKHNSFAVALSGLVLSAIAPLLTNSANNDFALFSYLIVVVLGTLWIVMIKKQWGNLIFASLVTVGLYSLPFISNPSRYADTESYLLIFAYIFTAIFFVSSIINILVSKQDDIKSFLFVAVGNGIFILSWILSFVTDELRGLTIAFWMVLFAVGAFVLFSITKIRECFYVYAGVAVAMLATATAVELNGAALTVAYIIEGAIIPLLVYVTTKELRASVIASFVLIAPVIMSVTNITGYFSSRFVFSGDFFVILLMAIVLVAVGIMYKNIKSTQKENVDINNIDNVFVIAGSVYAYILLWIAIHIGVDNYSSATTLSLIIFTIIGLVKYFYGISIGSKTLRNYGGLFLGLVVLRLLIIDVWSMNMSMKIIVFFLVGLLLMSTAFIGKKIKSGFTS